MPLHVRLISHSSSSGPVSLPQYVSRSLSGMFLAPLILFGLKSSSSERKGRSGDTIRRFHSTYFRLRIRLKISVKFYLMFIFLYARRQRFSARSSYLASWSTAPTRIVVNIKKKQLVLNFNICQSLLKIKASQLSKTDPFVAKMAAIDAAEATKKKTKKTEYKHCFLRSQTLPRSYLLCFAVNAESLPTLLRSTNTCDANN